jgi:hypothetical protein
MEGKEIFAKEGKVGDTYNNAYQQANTVHSHSSCECGGECRDKEGVRLYPNILMLRNNNNASRAGM